MHCSSYVCFKFDISIIIRLCLLKVANTTKNSNKLREMNVEEQQKPKKICFVPTCRNDSINSPDKHFLCVPHNLQRRKRWFAAVGKPCIGSKNIYCCEDHFNV